MSLVEEEINDRKLIILVAPNVTEQMGGEGIKALHIFQELEKRIQSVIQITHARNRAELIERLQLDGIYFVEDTFFSILLWKSVVFRTLLNYWFSIKAVRLAERISRDLGFEPANVAIWQTEPNSPVQPRYFSKIHKNFLGPINGNIYFPKIFFKTAPLSQKLRRGLHFPLQLINRLLFRSIIRSDIIFCAGGDRTRCSLEARGCHRNIIFDSLDCGISDKLFDRTRVTHAGTNTKFVHFRAGNLHKGTFLVIQSLLKTRLSITIDIIGRGPDIERSKAIVTELGLEDRVRFLGWFESHNEMLNSLIQYRGYLLPTLEDANGIAVQEAMALGLPPICLNWGGPQLLIDHNENGYLVDPISVDHITTKIAMYMDELANDSVLAEKLSVRGREKALSWRWSQVIQTWIDIIQSSQHKVA